MITYEFMSVAAHLCTLHNHSGIVHEDRAPCMERPPPKVLTMSTQCYDIFRYFSCISIGKTQ